MIRDESRINRNLGKFSKRVREAVSSMQEQLNAALSGDEIDEVKIVSRSSRESYIDSGSVSIACM